MQVESSASPLLTEEVGQFCPFHPHSTLELVEKAQRFCYVYCPEKMCFMFAPASISIVDTHVQAEQYKW